ncbi:hypothetical protein KC19_VG136700 [Ceratodon purpureus]|uniref:Ribonuclease H1 N-terminal domain-containing protein n=1 Tax=Ceratodon purpureus TaxID=3225 RepID=A0A8T0HQ25_CERPU|nr:hypothetical protein KC19_VG136700 [Ceratodon purpureus]
MAQVPGRQDEQFPVGSLKEILLTLLWATVAMMYKCTGGLLRIVEPWFQAEEAEQTSGDDGSWREESVVGEAQRRIDTRELSRKLKMEPRVLQPVKTRFYAVRRGRVVGIVRDSGECEGRVCGYKGAQFKSFCTMDDVAAYMRGDETRYPKL